MKDLKTCLERVDSMSKEEVKEEIKVIKSPIPEGAERLPSLSSFGLVTISIMLPSGIQITNPEQFEDNENESIEAISENSMAP